MIEQDDGSSLDFLQKRVELAAEIAERARTNEEYIDTSFYGKERVSVDVFVIKRVDAFHSWARGGKHVGWTLNPYNPPPFYDGGTVRHCVETVSFEKINNIEPKCGDLALVRKEGGWYGRLLSIEIIKDQFDETDGIKITEKAEEFIRNLPVEFNKESGRMFAEAADEFIKTHRSVALK